MEADLPRFFFFDQEKNAGLETKIELVNETFDRNGIEFRSAETGKPEKLEKTTRITGKNTKRKTSASWFTQIRWRVWHAIKPVVLQL